MGIWCSTPHQKRIYRAQRQQSTDCFNMTKLGDIFAANIHTLYDVFLINEGQFFEDILTVVQKLVEIHHKKVYICGLDGD